ncbi:hypothetical protein [Bacillus pumilus]|uniref:hypothetical protein n=1 Tax=Bacillus pumilus TaxID=1408 RepID=UPI0011E93267|nr:hypothetical protein [Bacillus pumilus]MBU8576345.1 hypothetical protein [Bacillus pumilus]TYS40432.1 hypothetical protein FZC68_16620 [Bacillus pumilus]
MAKYRVGDELMHSQGIDSVDLKIIYIPPIDGKGVQHYLCTVLSGYADGAKNMFLSLTEEKDLNNHFKPRTQPFIWA